METTACWSAGCAARSPRGSEAPRGCEYTMFAILSGVDTDGAHDMAAFTGKKFIFRIVGAI